MLFCAAFMANAGCKQDAPPPSAVTFDLNRPFSLALGQTGKSFETPDFTIKFDKIAADSRCPKGVECITAGQADVVITLSKGGVSETLTLPFILPGGTTNVTDFKGHTVRIMGVGPMKFKDKTLDPKDYNIVLTVIETPAPPQTVKLGQDFTLTIGERVALDTDPSTTIRFDSVAGDSRCAQGVQCIWAGKVDAVCSLTTGGNTQQATLATGDLSKGGTGEAKFGPYTLKINAVAPQKVQGKTIAPKEYKVALMLSN